MKIPHINHGAPYGSRTRLFRLKIAHGVGRVKGGSHSWGDVPVMRDQGVIEGVGTARRGRSRLGPQVARLSGGSALALTALAAALALTLASAPVKVVDGDSVRLAGWGLVRLDGIDTPELKGRCAAEKVLARRARARLGELLAAGPVQVTWGEARREKFGRPLVRISAGGHDVAETLIAEGLGRAYAGAQRGGWCG